MKEIKYLKIKLNKYIDLLLVILIEKGEKDYIISNEKLNILGIFDTETNTIEKALDKYAILAIEQIRAFSDLGVLNDVLSNSGFKILTGENLKKSLDKQVDKLSKEAEIIVKKQKNNGGFIAAFDETPINALNEVNLKPASQYYN